MRNSTKQNESPSLPYWQSNDREFLRQKFYESYDRSLVESMVYPTSRNLDRNERVHPIGEGRHFKASVLESDVSFRVPLVISQPKASFLSQDPTRMTATWVENMNRLKRAQLPLIPPFEIIVIGDTLRCLVTPFGCGGADQAKVTWTPIQNHVNMTLQGLQKLRLEIDDYLQIRTFEGIPFICDFSDLRTTINP